LTSEVSPPKRTGAPEEHDVPASVDPGNTEHGLGARDPRKATAGRGASAATQRAVALVADRRPQAEELGRQLSELTDEPEAFAVALRDGLIRLADDEYRTGQQRVAPGIGAVHGVRWPLLAAIERGLRNATKGRPTAPFLTLADRLFREPELEPRWIAFGLLERLVADDPERTWQLLRRAAREAGDWITVDTLAHPYGRGILLEPYRFAELEQLVYSASRWERRLVGSTIATIPFIERRRGRDPAIVNHSLPLIGQLMGDASPDVQKALAWALRSLTLVDIETTSRFCEDQAARAKADGDGHRAWVVRDTLVKLPPARAEDIRAMLSGIRRRPGAPSRSEAAQTAARFADRGPRFDPARFPEPPLT
jgi:3-methyladenine DNA glycosylase AlkD